MNERHDHDLDYAEKHHRHYDDEREVEGLRHEIRGLREDLRRELRALREDLASALGRIRQLEQQTPQARQLQYEADQAAADLAESESWRSTLTDYQVATGTAEYDDEDEHCPRCGAVNWSVRPDSLDECLDCLWIAPAPEASQP